MNDNLDEWNPLAASLKEMTDDALQGLFDMVGWEIKSRELQSLKRAKAELETEITKLGVVK